jgi:hypothetical protein
MPEIKKLQTITGVTITAPSDLSSTSSTIRISEYASDAAYVSANGAAAAGSVYISSATGVKTLRYYTGSSWRNLVPANDPADPTKIFYVDISGNTTAKFAKILFACTNDRTYTFQDETGTVPVLPILLASEVSGQLPIANGGTGQATAQTARNALLPTQSGNAGKFLKTDGTDVSWDTAGSGGAASSPIDATNYGFTASVGASALTIALKNAAGSDASVGDPITISMRNATLATGTYSSRSVTAALDIVVTSGATLGHTSGVASYIYVYALDNAGTVELAVCSRLLDTTKIYSSTVMSSSSDSIDVLYSTTARTNVPIRFLGKMLSNQTTAGTWASAPSEISLTSDLDTQYVSATTSGLVLTTTETDVGGSTINLTPGVWRIVYNISALVAAPSGTGTDGKVVLKITTSADALVGTSIRSLYANGVSGSSLNLAGVLAAEEVVRISTNTSYKLRAFREQNGGTSYGEIFASNNGSNYQGIFMAYRIG